MSFDTSDGNLILAFSSALYLAEFFESEQKFTEIAPKAVLAMAKEQNFAIGLDLGQDHGVIFAGSDISAIQAILDERESIGEAKAFQFVRFEPEANLVAEIENLLEGAKLEAVLLRDENLGLVLVLQAQQSDVSVEWLTALQAGLFGIKGAREIHLAIQSPDDPRWQKLSEQMDNYGVKLDTQAKPKAPKPPILRY